jgi:GntR family transcriptional regulator
VRSLRIDPTDSTPIWSQIEEGIRRLVSSSSLPPGGAVPSVRDLARELRVNPATVAKAYQRLADAGVLTVRRGEGTYVADRPPVLSRADRSKTLRGAAATYAALASSIGASEGEASDELASAWRTYGKPEGAAARGTGRKEDR